MSAAVAELEGGPTWAQVGICFVLLALGVGALWRFENGWGDGGQRVARSGGLGWFVIQHGFVLLPFAWAVGGGAVMLLLLKLYASTDIDGFAYGAMAPMTVCIASSIWAVKEFNRPSRWRREPAWLGELRKAGLWSTE